MQILLTAAASGQNNGFMLIIAYIAIIGGFFYFTMARPQKKEQNRIKAMLDAMEVGDSVLTSSGFYGVVIDIEGDTVIVEFGNNKNCRIPMQKTAVVQIEKPGTDAQQTDDKK